MNDSVTVGRIRRWKNGPKPFAMLLKALHRQPAQVDGENLDQHIADHEHRHRKADHRQPHHEAVDPGAVLPRRDHAERHRDHDRQHHRRERDRDRRLDPAGDHVQHRHVGNQRHPEIAVQQPADPGEELLIERLVQAERGADALELLGGRGIAGQDRGGIARRQPQQQEHEQRHHPHDGNGGQIRGEADIRASLSQRLVKHVAKHLQPTGRSTGAVSIPRPPAYQVSKSCAIGPSWRNQQKGL